ncbi:hypothetical protein RFI_22402 [Reticulomyxa filosa]|uniref:Uncharacterized protein n=1 Tax=Reticulomyxa filosa TaxID=46433 RepID=X6MNH1_RETFI|nr:hypothetical protein RFI_22402 [Reticulomyxa filosa]|eukprot:ETO14967.1 hypothetical protein RFI_22402 [Reticulomyxa filosa]
MTWLQSQFNDYNKGVMFLNFGSPVPGVYGMSLEGFKPTESALLTLVEQVQFRQGNASRLALKVHGGYQFGCEGSSFQSVLAAFLIGASQYCWFTCSQGYYITDNIGWYPEYNYSLGPPIGDAVKVSDTYIREFASGTVAVFNASTGNGTVFWVDFYPTPNHFPLWLQNLLVKQHSIGINIFHVLQQTKQKSHLNAL